MASHVMLARVNIIYRGIRRFRNKISCIIVTKVNKISIRSNTQNSRLTFMREPSEHNVILGNFVYLSYYEGLFRLCGLLLTHHPTPPPAPQYGLLAQLTIHEMGIKFRGCFVRMRGERKLHSNKGVDRMP